MFPRETRILVVDDAATMREQLKAVLAELGFKNIVEAPSGNTAFDIISVDVSGKSGIQLVFSDWHMPEMDGLELLKLVRTIYTSLPFILVTTEGEQKNVVRAITEGASNYIVKPVDKTVLEQKLQAVWNKHSR